MIRGELAQVLYDESTFVDVVRPSLDPTKTSLNEYGLE